MKKEIPLAIAAGVLFLYSCATDAQAKAADSNTPEPVSTLPQPGTEIPDTNKIVIPTPYVIPTEMPPTEIVPTIEIQPFLYFSQSSFSDSDRTQDRHKNTSKLSDVGCGVIVGAMVTRTDPNTYMQEFFDYFESIGLYGPARITKNGSDIQDHVDVLTNLGYGVKELSVEGSTVNGIKLQIKELTAQGIPVWINTDFYHNGHHSMAVGIAEDESIIFNDPLYGEGKVIPDSKIDEKNWKVYAIYPPGQ